MNTPKVIVRYAAWPGEGKITAAFVWGGGDWLGGKMTQSVPNASDAWEAALG